MIIWGCLAYSGVGNIAFIDDTMTVTSYIEVLRDILRFSASILGLSDTYHFQQDNDPKHSAWALKLWLLYNVFKRLNTPPQSTDTNLIENLWQILDLKVRKRHISSKRDLMEKLSKEWYNISIQCTKTLVESMPRRLQVLIEANGLHTKY